jgi:hypothetical protein
VVPDKSGQTAEWAYDTLRERIDALVDEAYPQFADGEPEIPESTVSHREINGNNIRD